MRYWKLSHYSQSKSVSLQGLDSWIPAWFLLPLRSSQGSFGEPCRAGQFQECENSLVKIPSVAGLAVWGSSNCVAAGWTKLLGHLFRSSLTFYRILLFVRREKRRLGKCPFYLPCALVLVRMCTDFRMWVNWRVKIKKKNHSFNKYWMPPCCVGDTAMNKSTAPDL